MTTSIQLSALSNLPYNELVQKAVDLGLKAVNKKKPDVIAMILEATESTHSVTDEKKSRRQEVEITPEMQAVLNADISKSNKMRQLHALGMPIAQITRELDTYYSFVLGAINRQPKQKKDSTESLPQE